MKYIAIVFCLMLGSYTALPNRSAYSVLDLLHDLEDLVEEDGKVIIGKLLTVIHHVEESVLHLKNIVPKVYNKIHEEADKILAGLKKVTDEVQELLGKKGVYYGFDLLGDLTELTGGTKLSTVLSLLSLADKAHRVMEDAKQFVPNLENELEKMQNKVEKHVHDFAKHVLKELGLQEKPSYSVIPKIEELYERVQEEAQVLILNLLHNMENTFIILREKLPEIYEKFADRVDKVREQIHDLITGIEKSLVMRSFSLLDLAGNVGEGTSLGTVFKVMSLVDKFNTVVQDVKNFGPKAEIFLQHSVKKVADSAQEFFSHAADKLIEI